MRRAGPPSALFSLTVLFFAFLGAAHGALVNHTIDDTKGHQVQYLPLVPNGAASIWENQTTCADCADVPDASLSFDNTWTAALYRSGMGSISISMRFSGTAIYVFFIVPNFFANSGLASDVHCSFFIDTVAVGSYNHVSENSGGFTYNTLVYKNITVPEGDHTLLIEATGSDASVVIFDYAIYTTGSADPDQNGAANPTLSTLPASGPSPPASTASPSVIPVAGDESIPSTLAGAPPPSTPSPAAPAFPTAPDSSQFTEPTVTGLPIFVTASASADTPSPSPASTDSPSVVTGVSASKRMSPVIAIVGGISGAMVLLVFIVVGYMVWNRRKRVRRHERKSFGTISVFDLIDHNPPPPSPRAFHSMTGPRPLPMPPTMSEQGRLIGATPSKPNTWPAPVASTSTYRPPPISTDGHGHSVQSSVSGYSDARADLHIHIPMTAFSPATPTASTHSPVTRHGAPLPPEQDAAVRALLLDANAARGGTFNIRRASMESRSWTPTTETGRDDDDDLWGPPMMHHVHVDSGIRISRDMMELPPDYSPS